MACHEAAMAKLATEGAVNTRAQIESELTQVQCALALTEEAHRRVELETWSRSGSVGRSRGGL